MTFIQYALAVIRTARRQAPRGLTYICKPEHLRAAYEVRLGIAEAATRLLQHYAGEVAA